MKNYELLIISFGFSIDDAKDVVNFIKKIENVTNDNLFDFATEYEQKGARWDDDELVENYNAEKEEYEKFDKIEDILKLDNLFHRLPSGIILSWKY